MAVYEDLTPVRGTFALHHAIALDLALLMLQEPPPSWWRRLLGDCGQREAIADLLEGVCAECGWDWIGEQIAEVDAMLADLKAVAA